MLTSKAAVLERAGGPFVLKDYPVPDLCAGAVICRVRMSTICGSDLHTFDGRRKEPFPLILGHEITGEVEDFRPFDKNSRQETVLKKGDMITWSLSVFCGRCFFCMNGLPQKCVSLFKYGHSSVKDWPYLTGGFSRYVYLLPGTRIYKLSEAASEKPEVFAPVNCTLATAFNAIENSGFVPGESVVIQGAGLLGLYLQAVLRVLGASKVILSDMKGSRGKMAEKFGADIFFNAGENSLQDFRETVFENTQGRGADIVFEACGNPEAVPDGMELLRTGGRYILAGIVQDDPGTPLSMNRIIKKCITIKGIHNYVPGHLEKGVSFIEDNRDKFPFESIVGSVFSIDDIDAAFRESAAGEHIRVGVVP